MPDFAPCLDNRACASGLCRGTCAKTCSASSPCPTGKFCDDGKHGGVAGYCSDQLANSQPCTFDNACLSNRCGTLPTGVQVCVQCSGNADCALQTVCNFVNRACVPKAAEGQSCWGNGNAGCLSGKCAFDTCVECLRDSDCGFSQNCDQTTLRCIQGCITIIGKVYCGQGAQPTPTIIGRCRIANCAQCNVAGTACSTCYAGFGASTGGLRCIACPDKCTSCSVIAGAPRCTQCNKGFYLIPSNGTCTATCPISQCVKCSVAAGMPAACGRCAPGYLLSSDSSQCDVVPTVGCVSDISCGGSKWCNSTVSCLDLLGDGKPCPRGSACLSGLCRNGNCSTVKCVNAGGCNILEWCNPASLSCRNLLQDFVPCTDSLTCASGFCRGTCAKLCSKSVPCPTGMFCDDGTNGGKAGYCSDQLANAQPCTFDNACISFQCGNRLTGSRVCVECKDNTDCPAGLVCDLASASCVQKAANGQNCWGNSNSGCLSGKCASNVCVECLLNSDCGSNQICDQSTLRCKRDCVTVLGLTYCARAAETTPQPGGPCGISHCATCDASGTLCQSCSGGYYLSHDKLQCTVCVDPGCSVCDAAGSPCRHCASNHYLSSGQCVPAGTCPITNCAACQAPTGGPAMCTRCSYGRYLTVDRLQCADSCPIAACDKCNAVTWGPATCSKCSSGYVPSADGLQCLVSSSAPGCFTDVQCLSASRWCGSSQSCQPQLGDGQSCPRGAACQSSLCVKGLCTKVSCRSINDCNTGQWCNPQSGLCNNLLPDNVPCPSDAACASGLCRDTCAQACSATSPCSSGKFCDDGTTTGNAGFCADLLAIAQPCTSDRACLSSLCGTLPTGSQVCVQCKGNTDCGQGQVCNFLDKTCIQKAANGESCFGNGNAGCLSGMCASHTCVECLTSIDCAAGQYCESTTFQCQRSQGNLLGGVLRSA